MKEHILIIDDDRELNDLLEEYLSKYGLRVTSITDPVEALDSLARSLPDLIILDIMLPNMDGFEVCREIRRNADVPIIMLTARGEVTDRIVGLEMGADDYLPKPFEPRELVARIQSLIRRSTLTPRTKRICMGDLTVVVDKRAVQLGGEPIELSTMEFEMLYEFVKHPGRVLSRDQLMDALRGIDWNVFDRSIDVLLSRLRHKLRDDPKRPRWIRTIRGVGYQFIGAEHE